MEVVEGELRWFGITLSNTFTQLRIVPISDVHFGNPLFSIKHFQRTIKYIRENEDAYCICNGDLIEAVTKISKGDVYKQQVTPQEQRDWIIAQLKPIATKVLGMTTGNHEDRIYRETGIDLSKDIAEALHIPYRAEGILLKVSFGDRNDGVAGRPYTYWAYATHGYGGARTKAAKSVKLERVAQWIHGDLYIMSHDHVVNVEPDIYLLPDPRGTLDTTTGFVTGTITAHRKLLVKSNAYLKWGGYSEMGGFPPVDLETPIITFMGAGQRRVKVEV